MKLIEAGWRWRIVGNTKSLEWVVQKEEPSGYAPDGTIIQGFEKENLFALELENDSEKS